MHRILLQNGIRTLERRGRAGLSTSLALASQHTRSTRGRCKPAVRISLV